MTFWSLGVLLLLKSWIYLDQRNPCIVFECFFLFWTIYCFLEPLPLTHALQHTYLTRIHVLACFIHIHMVIHDRLRWFESSLVYLEGFEVQYKNATCMPPIFLQRITFFAYCIINMFEAYLHVGL